MAHFDDVIEHPPSPLGGNDPRPLFLHDDEANSPLKLEENIARLQVKIDALAQVIKETAERVEARRPLDSE